MTAVALRRASSGGLTEAAPGHPLAVLASVCAVVGVRWAVWRSGAVDPILVGGLFGAALLAAAVAAGWRPAWSTPRAAGRAAALGVLGGLALVATALVGQHPAWSSTLAGPFPLAPWAVATVLVAGAEEALLRGVLFDRLCAANGVASALLVTSLIFSLMHVPVYGWPAVPVDLGVGLVLGGLRLLSGGVAAPAIAHAIADLAVVAL